MPERTRSLLRMRWTGAFRMTPGKRARKRVVCPFKQRAWFKGALAGSFFEK